MKKLVKEFTLIEMSKILVFMEANGIEIKNTFKKSIKTLDEEKASILLKYMLDMKLEDIKIGIVDSIDDVRVWRYRNIGPYTNKLKRKADHMKKCIPFIDTLTVERLMKIISGYNDNVVHVLNNSSISGISAFCRSTISHMISNLKLKEYDDSILPITMASINSFYENKETVELDECENIAECTFCKNHEFVYDNDPKVLSVVIATDENAALITSRFSMSIYPGDELAVCPTCKKIIESFNEDDDISECGCVICKNTSSEDLPIRRYQLNKDSVDIMYKKYGIKLTPNVPYKICNVCITALD